MIYLAYALIVITGIAAGTYLVMTGHYGWAWIPFVIAAFLSMERRS
ncbi:hypothetical protein V8918_02850 [Ralstonia mannitolilytica]